MATDSIRESKGVWPPWCDMTSGTPRGQQDYGYRTPPRKKELLHLTAISRSERIRRAIATWLRGGPQNSAEVSGNLFLFGGWVSRFLWELIGAALLACLILLTPGGQIRWDVYAFVSVTAVALVELCVLQILLDIATHAACPMEEFIVDPVSFVSSSSITRVVAHRDAVVIEFLRTTSDEDLYELTVVDALGIRESVTPPLSLGVARRIEAMLRAVSGFSQRVRPNIEAIVFQKSHREFERLRARAIGGALP